MGQLPSETRTVTLLNMIFFFCLFMVIAGVNTVPVSAQPAQISAESEIEKVTVFLNGGQVFRTVSVQVPAGRSTVVLTGLDPDLSTESIQLSTTADATVLSIGTRTNYLSEGINTEEVQRLRQIKAAKRDSLEIQALSISVYTQEEALLQENRSVSTPQTGVEPAQLEATANFFRDRLSEILRNKFTHEKISARLKSEIAAIDSQIGQLTNRGAKKRTAEIVLLLETDTQAIRTINFNYVTPNAYWEALYDLRVEDVDSPITLKYKANVEQTTGENWENVMMTLSTADPSQGNAKPRLSAWRIGYPGVGRLQPTAMLNRPAGVVYGMAAQNPRRITGRVLTDNGEPLPGANVICVGTSIGATTDINGHFELDIRSNCKAVRASFVGYATLEGGVFSNRMDFYLDDSTMSMDEVVVELNSDAVQQRARPPVELVSNTTSIEFQIPVPYSVPSSSSPTLVEVIEYNIDASYQYYVAPAVQQRAYLATEFSDWESLNLRSGIANIFFKQTFVGPTLLDAESVEDTLSISLGADPGISVKREQLKAFTSKRALGNKRTDSFGYEVQIRNNKAVPVTLLIEEQIPLSTDNSIEVNLQESSGAEYDRDTGRLKWLQTLEPGATSTLQFSYDVRYPKNRRIVY